VAPPKGKSTSKGKSSKAACKPPHTGPFRIASVWPHHEAPLVLVKDGPHRTIIATSFSPATTDDVLNLNIESNPNGRNIMPKWIMALPYEFLQSNAGVKALGHERPIVWQVKAALIWEGDNTEPSYHADPDAAKSRFHLEQTRSLKTILSDSAKVSWTKANPLALQPTTSDDTYLDTTRQIIHDIGQGQFYQINYLRYFHAYKALGWENLCHLMEERSGPFGCLMTIGSKVVASFSPERFVEISHREFGVNAIKTWPIKGTAPRFPASEIEDQKSGEALRSSEKDRAELRMIVDLMRNDLNQVCSPGSVTVTNEGDLKKFHHVWHLEGEISGTLRQGLSWRALLKALCPGGSITGAPKIAAMERIHRDEARERGFFMGNTFVIFEDGSMRSSINIRTLFSDNWMQSAQYAAGSGIVIKSDPHSELMEVKTKCQVLTSVQEC
jgi:anthranilate/para-aminobenzoate synthase component I